MREARQVASEDVAGGSLNTRHRIDVLDEGRNLVASVSFGEAVAIS